MSTDISTIVAKYVELRDAIDRINAETKTKTAPLVAAMETIESALMKMAIDQGVTSFKTSSGTAFITEKSYCGVQDWDAVLKHVQETQNFALLNKAVNKTAVQEFINAREQVPPGVKWTVEKAIQVRRS